MNDKLHISLENIRPLTEVRDHFSQVVAEVQKNKIFILTKGGKPAIALVDVKYLEELTSGAIKKVELESEIEKIPDQVGKTKMINHNYDLPHLPTPKPSWERNPEPKTAPAIKPEAKLEDQPASEPKPEEETKPLIEPQIEPVVNAKPAPPDPPTPAPAPTAPKPDYPTSAVNPAFGIGAKANENPASAGNQASFNQNQTSPPPVAANPIVPPPPVKTGGEEVDIQFSPDSAANDSKADKNEVDDMALD